MPAYPPEVMHRLDGTPEQMAAAMVGDPPTRWRTIVIEDHDPAWAGRFASARDALRDILGDAVAGLEHVGSTSVPGLPAKPIIDIDLLLDDTADESLYVPPLEGLGYRLLLREPWWYGHRMLIGGNEDIHLHVWPRDSPEAVRHRLFRDWLRTHPEDRDLYAATKRRLARETADNPGDYTAAKNAVIDEIFGRIFASA